MVMEGALQQDCPFTILQATVLNAPMSEFFPSQLRAGVPKWALSARVAVGLRECEVLA